MGGGGVRRSIECFHIPRGIDLVSFHANDQCSRKARGIVFSGLPVHIMYISDYRQHSDKVRLWVDGRYISDWVLCTHLLGLIHIVMIMSHEGKITIL